MQWWCSAADGAWSWAVRPYPGVWLFLAALVTLYVTWLRPGGRARRSADRGPDGGTHSCRGAFWGGMVMLWLALDWPVGALGGGYLATAHMVQYLLLSMAAPPLLLRAIPAGRARAWWERPTVARWGRRLLHPGVTLLLFSLVMGFSHVPAVLDTLMASQLGSFLLDLAWLGAGMLFWWPLLLPVPARDRMHPLGRMGYLFGSTIPATLIAWLLLFSEYPQYATYELAPPVAGLAMSPMTDQVVAALVMKFGGGVVVWAVITVLFFRWYREEEGGGGESWNQLLSGRSGPADTR